MSSSSSEDWKVEAACRGYPDPDVWFIDSDMPYDLRECLQVCAICQVQKECLSYAIESGQEYGVWGALTARQRRKLKKNA